MSLAGGWQAPVLLNGNKRLKRWEAYPRGARGTIARSRLRRRIRRILVLRHQGRKPSGDVPRKGINIEVRRGKIVRRVHAEHVTPMPEVFCLDENYEEVIGFLSGLRDAISRSFAGASDKDIGSTRKRRRVVASRPHFKNYVAFETMKRITPSAALILASEYDRARDIFKMPLHVVNYSQWQPDVKDTLSDLGFLDLFGIKLGHTHERHRKDILKFRTGQRISEDDVVFVIEALLGMLDRRDDDAAIEQKDELATRAYKALVEAMENVRLHAYPALPGGIQVDDFVPRWWMTGAFEAATGELTVVLYDQGISIPVSLPRWPGWSSIRPIFARAFGKPFEAAIETIDSGFDDAAIYAATRMGRSSTRMSHRGKGLPTMREVIGACVSGRLRIVSRRGDVTFETGKRPVRRLHTTPLCGTLIEWVVRL